jgi:hypothetical protein
MSLHQVTSEIAYDLMQDHLDTILALLDRPLPRNEVVERLGSPIVLDRLLRHGLVRAEGDTLSAVASVYKKTRQEGMVSFLEHYVLPSLTASIHDDGFATLENRTLSLSPAAMRALRSGRVQGLFDAFYSDRPERGVASRFTVMVVGTSRVLRDPLDAGNAALSHLQQASLQRSTAGEEDLGVITMYVGLADSERYTSALAAIERFLSAFGPESAPLDRANYHLTVASHWRSASASAADGTTRQSC